MRPNSPRTWKEISGLSQWKKRPEKFPKFRYRFPCQPPKIPNHDAFFNGQDSVKLLERKENTHFRIVVIYRLILIIVIVAVDLRGSGLHPERFESRGESTTRVRNIVSLEGSERDAEELPGRSFFGGLFVGREHTPRSDHTKEWLFGEMLPQGAGQVFVVDNTVEGVSVKSGA